MHTWVPLTFWVFARRGTLFLCPPFITYSLGYEGRETATIDVVMEPCPVARRNEDLTAF